jgi:hypothetical protein
VVFSLKACLASGKPLGAQGIAAETPQDLHGKSEELQRKARFFCTAKKCAQILN